MCVLDLSIHSNISKPQYIGTALEFYKPPTVQMLWMMRYTQYIQNMQNISNSWVFKTIGSYLCIPFTKAIRSSLHFQYFRNTQNTRYTQNIQKYGEYRWFVDSEYSTPSNQN